MALLYLSQFELYFVNIVVSSRIMHLNVSSEHLFSTYSRVPRIIYCGIKNKIYISYLRTHTESDNCFLFCYSHDNILILISWYSGVAPMMMMIMEVQKSESKCMIIVMIAILIHTNRPFLENGSRG